MGLSLAQSDVAGIRAALQMEKIQPKIVLYILETLAQIRALVVFIAASSGWEMGMRRNSTTGGGSRAARSAVGQIEAASTLLKFAADDLEELSSYANADLADEIQGIVVELQRLATVVFERALFIDRIAPEELSCVERSPVRARAVASRALGR